MRFYPSLIGLSAALFGAWGCSAPEEENPEVLKIEASQAAWVAAYNENDWRALADLFTHDAMLMPPGDGIIMGREEIANWERANEAGFQIQLEIEDIEISGDLAAVYGSSCLIIPGEDGPIYDTGKFVEIRRRGTAGDWLIAADIFNSDGMSDQGEC